MHSLRRLLSRKKPGGVHNQDGVSKPRGSNKRCEHQSFTVENHKWMPCASLAMVQVLDNVELLESILQYSPYRDLQKAYYTCTRFQDTIRESPRLRRLLLLQGDYQGLGELLPRQGFNQRFNAQAYHENLRYGKYDMFSFSFESLRKLSQQPRLLVLGQFILQPPCRILFFGLNFFVRPLTLALSPISVFLRNHEGIKIEDLVMEIQQQMHEHDPPPPLNGRVEIAVYPRRLGVDPLSMDRLVDAVGLHQLIRLMLMRGISEKCMYRVNPICFCSSVIGLMVL